jgi:hypothetical protein
MPTDESKKYNGVVLEIGLRVQSESNPEVYYYVSWNEDQGFDCNCPGYKFRKSCNHMAVLDGIVRRIKAEHLTK